MIKEAYCSYEVSKLLKEKGFDEACHAMYNRNGYLIPINFPRVTKSEKREFVLDAPTHQMAMAWLREVHHIIFVFKPSYFSGDECTYWTYERWCGDNFDGEVLSFKTYEEAVEAALKYCLENLI